MMLATVFVTSSLASLSGSSQAFWSKKSKEELGNKATVLLTVLEQKLRYTASNEGEIFWQFCMYLQSNKSIPDSCVGMVHLVCACSASSGLFEICKNVLHCITLHEQVYFSDPKVVSSLKDAFHPPHCAQWWRSDELFQSAAKTKLLEPFTVH